MAHDTNSLVDYNLALPEALPHLVEDCETDGKILHWERDSYEAPHARVCPRAVRLAIAFPTHPSHDFVAAREA
jgi:hypothetical protein